MSEPNRELADFLRRARAQIDPARAGLPADGRIRRVPGLRREEVALLAGVSTDYYTRLEQGRRITPTTGVVDAIARALDLDAAGRVHLGRLVGRPATGPARRSVPVQRLRPGVHQLLDSLAGLPALVLGHRSDVLASNWMANALFADFAAMPATQRNYARWMFLGEEPRTLFADWESQARAAVESLRLEVGNNPGDRAGHALVEELSSESAEFRHWWREHRVLQRTHGAKRLRHPVAGELTVEYETLTLPGDPDQTLYVYTTEPGSPSREAMSLLASWSMPGRTTRPR
ncbi:helix-turn-helix domain-containing protein [Nocardia flavorosea]|uniref:Helix-turn-helix transcriptional regulator n=1 Tax=Nocardia flavorosea TaxID=53429 RepID=A0A846YHX2_9NOCA|nr:helix-turn-helix transcriptional regulator [Nocardia flavorosea]NKY57421.1 helix-turn-helix transcriptional regulator [Nocardia flavorosea]